MFQHISGFSASASASQSAPHASGSAPRKGPSPSPSQPAQQYDQRWDALFGDGEEDPDKPDDRDLVSNKDAVIVLIDCCNKMMRPNDAGTIPFEMGLDAAILTLTDKIISSENDLLGVCFYGTKEKKNLNDFEGIYVAQDLDVPDAQRIIDLENLKGKFKKENASPFGTSETEFPFCDALWTCSTLFSTCPVKVGSRRIFLVTCEDHPNAGNNYLRDQAIQRARDLHELGIDIELFMIHPADRAFDPTHFFQEILAVSEDDDAGVINMDAVSKWDELKTRVRRKVFKKRSLAKLNFTIGPDLEFAVRLYNLTQDTKKGAFVWVNSKNNDPLKTVTKWVCEDTGTLLLPSQMKLAFTYGGEKVTFEKEEVNAIKTVDQPGIRLMGFKPKSALKVYHNLKHSAFLYPDELAVKGSTTAFAALLDRMIAKDKIAIARVTPRINSAPRFVALIPTKEKYDADNAQQQPGGFFVIPLPYADDIRKISIKSELRPAAAEQIVQAKKMVRSLRLPFDSRDFENPVLQKHYAALHALALEKEAVDEVPDMIMPDKDGFAKAAPVIQAFKSAVMSETYDPLAKPAKATKRKLVDPSEKKAKKERGEPVSAICQRGDAHKLTAPELKDFLMEIGVKGASKLKKQELVDKVNEVLGVQGNQPARSNSTTSVGSQSRLAPIDDDDDDDD